MAIAPDAAFLDEFWPTAGAGAYGLTRAEFDRLLLASGAAQNFGCTTGASPTEEQKAAYFRGLKIADLALAQACAASHERAWEHFIALYHEPLARAATAITGSETLGRELAGSLYAELYGMTERDGRRRSPLESYRGRGSLMGWLRTTLAQRHVDHHRRTHREQTMDDPEHPLDVAAPEPAHQAPPAHLNTLGRALEGALERQGPDERFLLAAYYLDGRTLLEIARLLGVHEATVSRRLRRAVDDVRKQLLRNLQHTGLSRRAAEEMLGSDPRDVDVNFRKLLQYSAAEPFPNRTIQDRQIQDRPSQQRAER